MAVAWLLAVIGGSATIKPRFIRNLFFFKEILLKDLAGQGEPAPAPFCLARILRQRLFRSDSVFSQNIILRISSAKKKSEHFTTNRYTRRNNSPFDMLHH